MLYRTQYENYGVAVELLVAGLNHRTAPLEVREKLAVSKGQLPETLKAIGSYLDQGVILSTCNRSEVYSLGPEEHLEKSLHKFLFDQFGISSTDVDRYLYTYRQEECIRHLFRVTSSLDSMILGEGQILKQVKDAFEAAVVGNTVQGPLAQLFHRAIRVGKRVRRDTEISRNALSVSRACVELARRLLGDLGERKVLVIGTGDAGKLAARALKESGVSAMLVTNRTYDRAEELAAALGGEAVPFDQMPEALSNIDIVIGSTGSPGYILQQDMLTDVMATRPHRPMFLIDIAVPRDIDPESAGVPNVHLYDVDDLQSISDDNRHEREQEARKAEAIVAQEVEQFLDWYGTLEVVPTITKFREKAEDIRARELSKLMRKLDHKLTSVEIDSLDAMTRALVNKLLHGPTTSLKERSSPEKLRLARELFNLEEQPISESEE